MNGDLSPPGAENIALDADDVPDVQLFEAVIALRPQLVDLHIDLDLALLVQDVAEGGLPHIPLGEDAAGNGHVLIFQGLEVFQDGLAVGCTVIAGLCKRIPSLGPEGRQLVPADLEDLAELLGAFGQLLHLFVHRCSLVSVIG